MTYANCILYGATLPSYRKDKNKDKKKGDQEVIMVDDPSNKQRISELIAAMK